jgi:hypothetical protein
VVARTVGMETTLEGITVVVRHASEPPDVQEPIDVPGCQSSSAAQSFVSMRSFNALRNDAA